MAKKSIGEFLVASCTPSAGVYRYRLYEDGTAEHLSEIPMPCPMFLALDGDRLWAVLRAPFSSSDESGLCAYGLLDGKPLTRLLSTKGIVACHLAVEGADVYCANYLSGSIFKAPDALRVHSGHGCDKERQQSPHAHSVVLSPDKKHVICCDLGLDTVFVYDRSLNLLSQAKTPDGAGVRHAVFSKDEKYLYTVNEMGGSVSVFSWEAPHLTLLNTVSVLPKDCRGGSGAAIKLSADGKYLYVTERKTESIITLRANGAELDLIARTSSMGKEPRDFTLLAGDRFAVCTNQFSDSVAVFKIGTDKIPNYLYSIALDAPLCAVALMP